MVFKFCPIIHIENGSKVMGFQSLMLLKLNLYLFMLSGTANLLSGSFITVSLLYPYNVNFTGTILSMTLCEVL